MYTPSDPGIKIYSNILLPFTDLFPIKVLLVTFGSKTSNSSGNPKGKGSDKLMFPVPLRIIL